jgi:hypothetical protein
MDRIQLVQNRDQWRALASSVTMLGMSGVAGLLKYLSPWSYLIS